MVKRKFYDILKSKEYNPKALQKLPFRMDSTGPLCEVTLLKEYDNPMDSIDNNDFTLKVSDREVTDIKVKKDILARLVYNHKDF